MKNLEKYLLRGTPSYLLPLGAGFVMASSATLQAALGMGVAVLVIALLSTLVINLLGKFLPKKGRLPIYILIVTGFTSIVQMLMQAWFPDVYKALGVHVAALSVSAVLYRDAEEVAGVEHFGKSMLTALLTGLFFTVIMLVCALFREFLIFGSLWGAKIIDLSGVLSNVKAVTVISGYISLAVVLAVIRKIGSIVIKDDKEEVVVKEAE